MLQTQWRTQLRALLLASGPCGLLYLAWWYLTPTAPVDVLIPSDLGVALLLPTIVAHELLHYMALPSGPACIQKGFVFRPEQSWAIGVGYQGEIGRSRLVAVLLTPLMVLSIAPLLVAAVFSIDSASLAYISIWNAIGSSLDLFNGSGLLLGVRTGAALRVQGMSIMTDGLRANVAKYFFHIPDDAQPTAEPEAVK